MVDLRENVKKNYVVRLHDNRNSFSCPQDYGTSFNYSLFWSIIVVSVVAVVVVVVFVIFNKDKKQQQTNKKQKTINKKTKTHNKTKLTVNVLNQDKDTQNLDKNAILVHNLYYYEKRKNKRSFCLLYFNFCLFVCFI